MNYILTGATGYIGKHLLAGLLQSGHRVSVIVRQKQGQGRSRVVEALGPFALSEQQLAKDRLTVLAGDITEEKLGLSEVDLQSLSQQTFDGFLHCAGLTRFEEHMADAIRANNIQGVKYAYTLARALNITHFHHVSTAYVLGTSDRTFSSGELAVGQGFNNPYEASKFEAECYLHDCAENNDGFIHIYRPSIVVGGHAVGENNTVSTIYVFLKAMHFIRECCCRDLKNGQKKFSFIGVQAQDDGFFIPLRVAASPAATINLVSVHLVTDRIIEGLVGAAQQPITTTALVGSDFRLDRVRDAFSSVLSITGAELVDHNVFQDAKRNVFEEKFFRSTKVYFPYMHNAPSFAEESIPAQYQNVSRYNATPEFIADEFLTLLDRQHAQTARASLNSLALDVLGVNDAHDYFERFINHDLGESFLQRIPYVDSKIRFHIVSEQPFDKVIHFNHGKVTIVSKADADDIACTYVIGHQLFNKIVKGRLDIRQAFFEGKIQIEGNKEIGLKFGFLFGEHYRNIDDRVIDEVLV
jgi:nucleoside-diphosphate-sugar epimerase/putative sterol carrier protein